MSRGGENKAALVKIELDSGVCIDEVDDPGIDVDRGVVNEASDTPNQGASVGRPFDVALDRLVNKDEVPLKSYGVEEGAEVVSLLTTGGHVGDPFPLEEKGGWIAIGIVEECEKLGGILDQPGADFPVRHGVECVVVVEGEQTEVLASIEGRLRREAADLATVLNCDTELVGVQSTTHAFTDLGEGGSADETIPSVANAEGARSVVFFRDEHGPAAEPEA